MRERAAAMVERVTAEARAVLDEAGVHSVREAVTSALLVRDRALENDHDPRYLHPGRTIRILIADVDCRRADALAAAAFVDTVDTHLATRDDADERLRPFLDAIPLPARDDDDDLLERLVTADRDAAVVALAERLDQARHLHLRRDLAWQSFHAGIRASYIPAARRLAPLLGRRFERWADAFERRLLLPG